MTPKIARLKQRNAQAKLRQRFACLEIAALQSAEDAGTGSVARQFCNSGIWRCGSPAAAAFPFHHNGVVDHALYRTQHQAARAEMVRRIRALHADKVWISLQENGFGFWANIPLAALIRALDGWFARHGDFALYIEHRYALAIHDAEYEWEVLERAW